MELHLGKMGFANLFHNGFNAIQFSFIGLLIIFGGLTLISLYIVLLPKLLPTSQKRGHKQDTDSPQEPEKAAIKTEILLAIATAIHLDRIRQSDNWQITWPRHADDRSSWLTAGRIRQLAVRSHLPRRP